jgi:cyclopropane-fatty-acyl-phospholipid synthase
MNTENKSSGTTISSNSPGRQDSGGFSFWLLKKLHEYCGNPPVEMKLWNGAYVRSGAQPSIAKIRINTLPSLLRLVIHADLYFGEDYMKGNIEVEGDLEEMLVAIYTHKHRNNHQTVAERVGYLIQKLRTNNSLSHARDNIHHHYDLGNDFYRLWLDTEAMQYTCAYYASPEFTLEQAQVAKLDHVCRKLQLKPGDTVVEAGCGWGGLARHIARHYGAKVKAYNISHEQVKYARERAEEEGLSDLVEYIEDDYRNINEQFDVFVSIGMLEHVGIENYNALGDVIDRCLKPDGLGLIHTIGRNQASLMNAWIEKRIFPSANPPSLRQMMDIFEPKFSVLDVENLRLHYAFTLRDWLERFENNKDKVSDMFDEEFIRAWRLYLAGSAAAFESGQLQLFQVVFARDLNNQIPRTREHLYIEGEKGKNFND